MKIDESARIAERRVSQDASEAEGVKKRREEPRAAMNFVDEAADLSGVADDAPSEADHNKHVDDIKSRVRAGTYFIDSYKVADKFLREALVGAV